LLFPSAKSAADCKAFGISKLRKDDALKEEEVSIRVFDMNIRIYAVFFPSPKTPIIHGFWFNAGVGVCSRLGEDAAKHLDSVREIQYDDDPAPKSELSPAHVKIQERIAGLLERAPTGPPRSAKVSPGDVYLYQTGMAGIYNVHQTLQNHYYASSILFGFAFQSTIHIFLDWDGPGFKFFGSGNDENTDALEAYLESETKEGKKVQALWTEFPSNPILATPNLSRLRTLAEKYKFALIVDDTVGSFANVDVLAAADIVVSSLSKSFSGYADVMGSSAVLNPSSHLYPELKALFEKTYRNDVYTGDAVAMELNSRDYMVRSHTLNNNAAKLVEYLKYEAEKPESSIGRVYYPPVLPSLVNYTPFMRTKTADFVPGYGCLFSVELESVEETIAFYDNLNVHMGPHLGAHLTLALPYVKVRICVR
jgi:cystathionine gamma-synthase